MAYSSDLTGRGHSQAYIGGVSNPGGAVLHLGVPVRQAQLLLFPMLSRPSQAKAAVLANRRQVLGENHPATIGAGTNLAGAYYAAGDLGRAIPTRCKSSPRA